VRRASTACAALVLLLCLTALLAGPDAASACGRETDCIVGSRSYRAILPASGKPRGAVIFAHGYRGSAEGAMASHGLVALAEESGIALVAVNGVDGSWNLPNTPGGHDPAGPDEAADFEMISKDIERRFGVGPDRTIIAGFSSGGMLVWHLACQRGAHFAGFVAMSGTFWAPVPDHCPEIPRYLAHYHGTVDPVVPMQGRPIREARQGDIHAAIDMLLGQSDFGEPVVSYEDDLTCSERTDGAGRVFELCLFAGGHMFRPDFIARAVRQVLADP
jgi:polyhydroxybutyrate depolymerase